MDELEERDACTVQSIGWALQPVYPPDVGDYVTIVPHHGDAPAQGCGEMTIPTIAIKKIERLKIIHD